MREGLSSHVLCRTAFLAESGLVDADLGKGLLKMRIAREGQGKSKGYRTILATRWSDVIFFIYGYAKNVQSNIDAKELSALCLLASSLLSLSSKEIESLCSSNSLMEVHCNEQDL